MNRKIIFRGIIARHHGAKKWMYGYYNHEEKSGIHDINNEYSGRSVDGETVGQFIGETDITGRDIYEGDILCDSITKLKYLVKFASAGFHAFRIDEGIKNYPINLNKHDINIYHLHIIGNIYENPEMMNI